MNTINGKLVHINGNSLDTDLKSLSQPEEVTIDEIELLQISLEHLTTRVNFLEINRLQQLQNKLEVMEKRTAQQLFVIAIFGSVGLTGLGAWIGLNSSSLVPISNSVNYSELQKK